MKAEISSYITALINAHRNEISPNVSTLVNNHTRKSTNELIQLLEFINSIPEEKVTDTYVEINRLRDILARVEIDSDTETLRRRNLQRRVAELEESCEIMCEVEKNNHITIKELESSNVRYRGQLLENDKYINQLKEVNTGVWEENRQIKLLNKRSFRKIKILKNKLKNKLKGDC